MFQEVEFRASPYLSEEALALSEEAMSTKPPTGAAKAAADKKREKDEAARRAKEEAADAAPLVPKSKEEQKAELQKRLLELDDAVEAPKEKKTRKTSTSAEVQAQIEKANEAARKAAENDTKILVDGDSSDDERAPPLRAQPKAKAKASTPAGSVAGEAPVLLEVGAAVLEEAPLLEASASSSVNAVPDLSDFPVARIKVHKNRDFYNLSVEPGRPRFVLPDSPVVAVNLYENYGYAKVTVQLSEENVGYFDAIDRGAGLQFQKLRTVPWERQLRKMPHLTFKIYLVDAPRKPAASLRRLIGAKRAEPQESEVLTTWFRDKVQKYEHFNVGGEVELVSVSLSEQGATLAMPVLTAAIFTILNEAPEGLLPVEEVKTFERKSENYMQGLMARSRR
jgi:hypothetical protein